MGRAPALDSRVGSLFGGPPMNAVANHTTPEQSASTTAPDARTRRAEYRMRARRVRALGPLDVRPAAEQAREAGRVSRVIAIGQYIGFMRKGNYLGLLKLRKHIPYMKETIFFFSE